MDKIVRAKCLYCGSENIFGVRKMTMLSQVVRWHEILLDGNVVLTPEYAGDGILKSTVTDEYSCRDCGETFTNPVIVEQENSMSEIEKFVFKWKGYRFQSSTVRTEEFNNFSKQLKAAIKRDKPSELEFTFNVGHFFVSGFFHNPVEDKWAYYSISDVRYFQDGWVTDVLIRTAQHDKDYTGGRNNSVGITQLINKACVLTGVITL